MFESAVDGAPASVLPGPDLAAWLASIDVTTTPRAVLIDALAAGERLTAWVAATQARVLAALHAEEQTEIAARLAPNPDYGGGSVPAGLSAVMARQAREWVASEVGLVLRILGDYAQQRMLEATHLLTQLPTTFGLLDRGDITASQVRALVEATLTRPADVTARIEERVLKRAAFQSTRQFGRSLQRAVMAYAPVEKEAAHADALADRRVYATPGDDGVGTLWAKLPAPELLRVDASINGRAKQYLTLNPDDGRDLQQRRADALVELIDLGAHTLTLETGVDLIKVGVKNRPLIHVVVSLATLTGDSDEPGDLAGFGPIPATLTRRIAFDPTSTWRRLVTDPLEKVIGYGRERYEPPAELDHYIRARDQHCQKPTCTRPAATADLDHLHDWGLGGETEPDNLTALCPRDHHLKHDNNWTITRNPTTGYTTWTSPTNHHYPNPPPELPDSG